MRTLVVTPQGPCFVDSETSDEIMKKRQEIPNFAIQILLFLRLPDEDQLEINVFDGEIPKIKNMEEFEKDYVVDNPPMRPRGRNIVL